MLRIVKRCSELDFAKLMDVYEEGNRENGESRWPSLSPAEQLLRAERDFYSYLQEDFFPTPGAYYALWEEAGVYVSALRMEPYEDGMLLQALETKPDCRRRGYAFRLMQAVLSREIKPVYSHVSKKNTPSLGVHQKCGFRKIADTARYINGTVSANAVTLCKEP